MSADDVREAARALASRAVEDGTPLDWFGPLYRAAERDFTDDEDPPGHRLRALFTRR